MSELPGVIREAEGRRARNRAKVEEQVRASWLQVGGKVDTFVRKYLERYLTGKTVQVGSLTIPQIEAI